MKIRKLTPENHPKVYALLTKVFTSSSYEVDLIKKLHLNKKMLHEWVCIHAGKVIAYIAFSNAFHDKNICGLHLAPLAVKTDFQNKGIDSELLKFCLRQPEIKDSTLFVLGNPNFYQKFDFKLCSNPVCPFDRKNQQFLSIRNDNKDNFTVGYEPEFSN